jgi:transcriptional regulator with XRE-family HTH domain
MARVKLSRALRRHRAEIGGRLRMLRKGFKKSGPEFAREIGIPPRSWQNYESGVQPPMDVVLMLIIRFGVSPWWLLTGARPIFSTVSWPHAIYPPAPPALYLDDNFDPETPLAGTG